MRSHGERKKQKLVGKTRPSSAVSVLNFAPLPPHHARPLVYDCLSYQFLGTCHSGFAIRFV